MKSQKERCTGCRWKGLESRSFHPVEAVRHLLSIGTCILGFYGGFIMKA